MDDDFDNTSRDFSIPDYILVPGSKIPDSSNIPTCPVVVFINTKSGGQLGGDLLINFRSLLNENQVFDLGEKSPDVILQHLYGTLEKLKQNGDTIACEIQRRLRIIACGGDGTANWLLGAIADLNLPQPPPVAIMPLGTGNNLPFSFGWGKKNPGTDKKSVVSFLDRVKTAMEMKIDCWHITMTMKAAKEGSYDPIGPNQSRSLNVFHRTDTSNMEGLHVFQGRFWNYFSMGMDAQVSYAFHLERESHPEKFKKQLINQSTYLKLGCTQGWFCAPLLHPSSRNIARLSKVRIMKREGQLEDLPIPPSIRSIVCLNLPCFSGGLNPWGSPSRKKSDKKGLSTPYVDDGLIEIVGFRDAWHGLIMLFPKGHGTHLAQTSRVCLEFHKDSADHTYMRVDGEPWKQPLPVDEGNVSMEIFCSDQGKVLATPLCQSKNTHDTSLPVSYHAKEDNRD